MTLDDVTFQREPASPDLYREWRPLFDMHGSELRGMAAAPDFSVYDGLEAKHQLVAVSARLIKGAGVVGYSVHVVMKDFHFQRIIAHDDVWFVMPAHRGI